MGRVTKWMGPHRNEPPGSSGATDRIVGWAATRRFPLDAALAGAAEEEAGEGAVIGSWPGNTREYQEPPDGLPARAGAAIGRLLALNPQLGSCSIDDARRVTSQCCGVSGELAGSNRKLVTK